MKKLKTIVAMSGGVDSSVAAALLKKAGWDVVGAFMKFWSFPAKNGLRGAWNRCCCPEAEKRARWVAVQLGIPFHVFNFEKEFKQKIVDYFLAEHRAGRTPNPCVVCNKEIKFNLFAEKGISMGADYIATGHYARILKTKTENKILQAKDKQKDQSYFLWQLTARQIKPVLFPVGNYTKSRVRELAERFELPISTAPESMEICFIHTTIDNFLTQHLKPKPGKIVDVSGKTIGKHSGLFFYTIGQRKRIGLPGGPYWVLSKDLKRNFLIVTKNEKDLYKKELICQNINWISGKEPKLPLKMQAKIRYRANLAKAVLTHDPKLKATKVRFEDPQRAITPGQSVAFYRGQELLGGGIIAS